MSETNPQPAAPRRSAVFRALRAAWLVAPWSLVALLAWSDRPYWTDLASHFLLHAAAACVVVGATLAAIRRWRSGLNLLLVSAVLAGGWRLSASAPGGEAGAGRTLRLVEYNARGEWSRHDNEAMRWLRDQRADLIVLIEPPFGLLNDYPFLRREFPYSVEPSAGLMWEVIVLSRFPAEVRAIAEYSEENKFSFAARRSLVVRPPGVAPFLLTAMHPLSPRTKETWRASIDGVRLNGRIIRDWSEKSGMDVVVGGDFNSTPVGRLHRLFARESGLLGWSRFSGGGTWPARLPAWFSLPIDRVWTSEGVGVRSMTVGPRFRSDHRPIVCDLVMPAASEGGIPEQAPASEAKREREGSDGR